MCIYTELEAACLPLIQHYHNDLLKWDKEMLEEFPDCPFLHYTNEFGTHIIMLPAADDECYPPRGKFVPYLFGTADRDHILREKLSMAEYHTRAANCPERFTVHHFDGRQLRKITVAKGVDLAKEYVRSIEHQWSVAKFRVVA